MNHDPKHMQLGPETTPGVGGHASYLEPRQTELPPITIADIEAAEQWAEGFQPILPPPPQDPNGET